MILIVDDKPENIFSLKSILELHSFVIDTALSGEEALKKALKQSYALIILDVQMPGMDGFEVAEILATSKNTKDTPIIFLSALNTEKKFISKGYSTGAIDYIIKPIDTDILLSKVKIFNRLYEQKRELNLMQQNLHSEIEFRKKAQVQIQEKVQELHSILEAIPQIAFTATTDGKIEYVNAQWYDYTSTTHKFPDNHPDDANIEEVWLKTLKLGEPLELEIRIKETNKIHYRYHLLRAIPVKEDGTIVKWVGSFTDIEEQKHAAQKKDEFLTIASHELRTPLTSIKAYVQLLDQLIPTENHTKPYINRTLLQVNKLDNLVNDLLDISKIESDKLKFELTTINFEELLSATLDIFYQIYPKHNIIIKGNAAVNIIGNAVRLEQVIINFLTNAIKYAPDSTEIHVFAEVRNTKEFYFGVQDFGIGIPKESQADIFGKFFRVNHAAKHIQGLGIGLYICSEILKIHSAKFGVVSEPGKGSLFYFILPATTPALN